MLFFSFLYVCGHHVSILICFHIFISTICCESGSGSNKIHFYQKNMETPWTQSINPNKTNMQSKTEE